MTQDPPEHILREAYLKTFPQNRAENVFLKQISNGLFPVFLAQPKTGSSPQAIIKTVQPSSMGLFEASGINALRKAGAATPELYNIHEVHPFSILIMEYIPAGGTENSDRAILVNLHILYNNKPDYWGWETDGFIGSLPQPNSRHNNFRDFWLVDRIEYHIRIAQNNNRIPSRTAKRLIEVCEKLIQIWNLENTRPSLIHGDLWSGNIIFSNNKAYLIDPSICAGNPEQDLAMLLLFGGSPPMKDIIKFFELLGHSPGFEERINFWQMYPLLVHINLFGSSYLASLENALNYYT